VGIIEAGRLGERRALDEQATRFDLPDHLELLTEGIVLDGGEGDTVLGGGIVGPERVGGEATLPHFANDVAALADFHELSLRRE
jgi:hypothetical protein